MLRFVITAGGTEEDIDGVRKITNFSTGALGWQILGALLSRLSQRRDSDFHIHYVHGARAHTGALPQPAAAHITLIPVTDASSVAHTVGEILQNHPVDAFIHSMAISDFTFSYASGVKAMAREIFEAVSSRATPSPQLIERILLDPRTRQGADGTKITSADDLLLGLKPTPKVISMIKTISPAVYLIGFKLLRNATEAMLMEAAADMARKNRCDAVLANDLSDIGGDGNGHKAFLLKDGKIIARGDTKGQIADIVAGHCLENVKCKK